MNHTTAPKTLPEALNVIRAMHTGLLAFRDPEFDLIASGREGDFDDRVKSVLAHSAPVIKADRHDSDCAQHNEPAMPAGPCDCSASDAAIETKIQTKASSGMDFGAALNVLKAGGRVARIGWNGVGLWLEYRPGAGVDLPFIRMSYPVHSKAYPLGARVPWLASQTDMLAEDWVLVE